MNNISLSDWLALLESRHPTEIDLGLDRVAEVYQRLGDSVFADRVISVAGTNGKGSCVATLAALLRHGGLNV
ncbi:MAG: bifunctional tetrahydrofolate synthase/dihydrofolate synthase, partial [Porticoccaceae bacterium]|nr:bifunctional tetrahydrofolate synthase/dihydrofolate synthase [Porticoccaceae bacterium]